MSESDTPRRPGPWDPRPEDIAAKPAATEPTRTQAAEPPLHKGQNPVLALASTLLLGGLIWYLSDSWVIAVALIWGLFIHEYGHVLAMNRLGMGPARIHIIPFFGGAAVSQRLPQSEWHGVLVSLAGPAFGLLAAIPWFAGFIITRQPEWLVGAAVIAAVNLINLAPAPPLDGSKALGPVLARIHPLLEQLAMLAVGALILWWAFMTGRMFLVVFLAIALIGHMKRGVRRPEGRPLSGRESVFSVVLFLATAVACAAVGIAALMPLGGGSLPVALGIAAQELGIAR
ncbi:MAG: peptidase M50 [Brevundimonas sp.]|nr:peptidase M50 [Brevundimonas sp.]